MSSRIDVLLWANRVSMRAATAQPHELLEIAADASLEAAQDAFHKIAKLGHPDLHRGLQPDELEKVTSAYAAIANAYQAFRAAKLRGGPPAPLGPIAAGAKVEPRTRRPSEQAAVRLPGGVIVGGRTGGTTTPRPQPLRSKIPTGGPPARPPTQPPPIAVAPAAPTPAINEGSAPVAVTTSAAAAQAMNSKALVYYRKAEIALRRGDLRAASLNLKLAVAADPHSAYLRQALGEVEQELKQTP